MNNETAADTFGLSILRACENFDYHREYAAKEQARYATELDYLTRPGFKDNVETALRSIAKMLEGKPIMLACMEKDLGGPNTGVVEAIENTPEQFEVSFNISMYYSHHERDWTREEAEKALYYEIMSFCKDDDAPFCDPNCAVKVDYSTIIALTLPFPINEYLVSVKFSVKVPDAVLTHLSKKGMVQSSPGYSSPPTLAIVCPSGQSDIPF